MLKKVMKLTGKLSYRSPCIVCCFIIVSVYACLLTFGGRKQILMTKMDMKFVTENASSDGKDHDLEVPFEHFKFWADKLTCENISLANDLNMTSEIHSKFKLNFFDEESGQCQVEIVALSWSNVTKKVGGDLFLLWAEQIKGDGCSSGYVIDNRNGSYTGRIKIFWPGETNLKVKLASTIENFCRRKMAMIKYGNSVFALKQPWGMLAKFQANTTEENTRCAIGRKIKGYMQYCNFTAANDGSPWFCGNPDSPKLNCDDIFEYNEGGFESIANESKPDPSEIISRPGHGQFSHTVKFTSTMRKEPAFPNCSQESKHDTWFNSDGFYLAGMWHTPQCASIKASTVMTYKKCLRNKTLVFLGDSTVRDYANFFLSNTISLPLVDLKHRKSKNRTYHPEADFERDGIRIIYKKHELPFHHPFIPPTGITSEASEIQALIKQPVDGKDLVLLINYNSHFLAYPPDQIRPQLRRIARSVESLLRNKPGTSVFIRGAHVYFNDQRWFDPRFELIEKDVIFQEFQHLQRQIVYLDVWPISVAFNNEVLHPVSKSFQSQIQQFMSYICT